MTTEPEGSGKLHESRAVRLVAVGSCLLLVVALSDDFHIDKIEQVRAFAAIENWIIALIVKWGAEDVAKKLPLEWGKDNAKNAANIVINEDRRGP